MLNELIERCKNNDRKAQKIVYEYLFGKMFSLCMRYASSEDEAGEILNAAFLKVFTKLNSYSGEGSFEGWVKSIVVRTSIDTIRQNKSYKQMITIDTESDAELENDYVEIIETEELFLMIAELPPTTKSVFNMVAVDGYSHEEAAKLLSISYSSCRWHLSEARKRLKKMIDEYNKTQGELNHG